MSETKTDQINYSTSSLSSGEKQTLEEYKKLADQLSTLKHELTVLNNKIDLQKAIDSATKATNTTGERQQEARKNLIAQLRALEQTLSMFGTLFKSSVYKILMNSEDKIEDNNVDGGNTKN